jgi:amino acid adenylation domain-containing protein
MSIAEFISDLSKLDIRLSVNGQRLRVNAPKGVLTSTLRAQIAERKQELLQFLSDHERSAALIPPPILRRTGGGPAPLSFAQERLWFLEQLEPGSAVYNICRAFRLSGNLNIAKLEASLAEILRRHEILRSQICATDARPMQITAAPPEFKLHFSDLRLLTRVELDDEIRGRISAEGERQFDFSVGVFLRAVLLQIRNDEHILILTTHHIVSDAWSMGILTKEVWTLYDAYANGKPSPLQELPVQYADYAFWQREWLQGKALESQLSYWREQLKDLPILNLPTDHPRPVKQSFRGARQSLSLSESLTKAVNELSGREGVTQFMTLLAAFQVLLYRYSGQEDVVIGLPIANRNRAETQELIGFFVNTLVLRADLSEKPTFKKLLQRVRNVCLQAYAHQDLPFEKLVEELRPDRDLSRNPLFQVMFVLQNTPRPFQQPVGLSIERIDALPATSLFDLSLYLREREGKLIGFFEYNTDLFEPSTIERMIGHFLKLLEGIVADPEQPISTMPLLTEAERYQLLVEWNNTETEYPKNVCIHGLFEAQAAKNPESIALEFEGKQLTYGELNRRANQLAHYLRRLGIGPEKLVGICIERSMEMVIGLLGILKAGGAYIPLDPSYPRERLAFMLDDSQASVLLTSERIVEGFKMQDDESPSSILDPQMKLLCLDTHWEVIALESEQNTRSEVKPDNLAYVIYTSGSTGQPKGVAIEHRNTTALLHWARSVFTPEELSGVLASTSICFDLSIFELFVPLSWGGKVILVENVLRLPSSAGRHQVTLINTVPSAMTELLKINGLPESLRTVNLAGEPLRSDLVEQIYGGSNVNKVYDLYGPSETTTYTTFTLRASNQPATIGRPIANSRIYILDGSLEPVPVGVTGEIFIGGAGVARGYLNRSQLTAEMFIADLFRGGQGGKLYRTGDRGRYLPDGNIEFIGRMDNQVKIRGYRIELGEIEAILTKHPTVKDCVVVASEREAHSGRNLVGYIVPREHSVLSGSELRKYLKEKLPEYMIPSSFVVLEALPLIPNGKVDRNTLPLPDGTRPPLTGEFASPRTEIEELIAQTWREVLKIENVGIYDNFFELGGHSLLATQIVARLQEAFNKDVPLRVLFDAPTIAELAQELETIIRDGRSPELPPIVPVPRDGPIPLSMNQKNLWRVDQMMPGTHFFNITYVYRLWGVLNLKALEEALTRIVARHEALRTVFAIVDGTPVQIIKDARDFCVSTLDLTDRSRADACEASAARILEHRLQPFNLATGPLLRVELVLLTDSESLLLVTMHHIITDDWSMKLFRRELLEHYEIIVSGFDNIIVPEPQIQMADYAFWERQCISDGQFGGQDSSWKDQTSNSSAVRGFDEAHDDEAELESEFRSQSIIIDEQLFKNIKTYAKKKYCTPFLIVLSAVFESLRCSSGESNIRVATFFANRERRATQDVFGNLAKMVVLNVDLSCDDEFHDVVHSVRRASLGAQMRHEMVFKEDAQPRGTSNDIAVSTLVNYRRRNSSPAVAGGVLFSSFEMPAMGSELQLPPTGFDVIFDLREAAAQITGTVNIRRSIEKSVTINLQAILEGLIPEPEVEP